MTAALPRPVSAGILAIWGSVLLSFEISGRVASYLHPAFHIFLWISGIVLLAIAAIFFVTRPTGEASRMPLLRVMLMASILVVPLLGAAWISPSQFGATAVLNRGFVDNVGDLPAYTPPMDPPLPREDGSIGEGTPVNPSAYLPRNKDGQIQAEAIDLLYAASDPGLREDFDGQEVELIGQFLPSRTGNPEGNRFQLVRLFVMCCAADARPLAVTVEAPPGTSFPEMEWIKVTGKAAFPVESGRHTPVVKADAIEQTEPPPETFLY